jgi:hypothetical protein
MNPRALKAYCFPGGAGGIWKSVVLANSWNVFGRWPFARIQSNNALFIACISGFGISEFVSATGCTLVTTCGLDTGEALVALEGGGAADVVGAFDFPQPVKTVSTNTRQTAPAFGCQPACRAKSKGIFVSDIVCGFVQGR